MEKKLTALEQIELILNDECEFRKLEKIEEVVKKLRQDEDLISNFDDLRETVTTFCEGIDTKDMEEKSNDLKVHLFSDINDPLLSLRYRFKSTITEAKLIEQGTDQIPHTSLRRFENVSPREVVY